MSGSKHIVSAVVDVDVFTGSCKGTGRIQIRLNHGETADSVRLNYLRLGYKVEDFNNDPRKKPTLTQIPYQEPREITDAAHEKQKQLATQRPDIFGQAKKYYPQQYY